MTEVQTVNSEMNMETTPPELTEQQTNLVAELNGLIQRHEYVLNHFIVDKVKLEALGNALQQMEARVNEIQKELNSAKAS